MARAFRCKPGVGCLARIQRSRNSPPRAEVWSGQSLNDLLTAINRNENANGVRGPDVPVDEATLRRINVTDGATRVSNPKQGLIRIAGVSLKGFDGGQLYAARFTVMRPTALASVGLTFDEMHTAARANARVVVMNPGILK